MKHWLWLLTILLGSSLCQAGTVTVKWTYDYSKLNSAPCTVTVTTNCTTGFSVYYISPSLGTRVVFARVSNSGTETGVVTGISGRGYVGINGTNIEFDVIAVGKDEFGSPNESIPLSALATIRKVRPYTIIVK